MNHKPTEAVAMADAFLNDAGLPTYGELRMALRAVATGATRGMGKGSTGHGYAHLRMESLQLVLATVAKLDTLLN